MSLKNHFLIIFIVFYSDSAKLQIDKNIEVHSYANISKAMKKDFGAKIKDLPVSLKILFQNPTFMFLNLAGACEGKLFV